MKSIQLYPEELIKNETEIAIILGYFDGVHCGHKEIINAAINKTDLPLALLTFDKPVSDLINNGKSKEVLTSLDDRFRIINRYGVDYYYVLHIDQTFLDKSPLEFIKFLKDLNVSEIYVGEDYRFGKNASGDIKLLKQHFKVTVVQIVSYKGKKISSQGIIQEIKNGNISYANALMGQNYLVNGTVVEGHHNGSLMGIKTANVKLDTNYVIPKFGVYKVIAYIDGISHLALTNVGIHPTIDEEKSPLIEVHIPGIDEKLYDKAIYIEFLEFIRPEIKFSSTELLIKQIQKDLTLLDK